MNARLFQQIRLWVYVILLVLLILSIWDRHADFVAFLMFAIVLFLPYLEVCPTCGKLAWLEGGRWPNVLWIGAACRAAKAPPTVSSQP